MTVRQGAATQRRTQRRPGCQAIRRRPSRRELPDAARQPHRMRTELARCSDGLQSTLVVLANTSATQALLPTAVANLLAAHSNIDIELQERPSHEIVAAVTDGRAELGIIADTVDSGRLECSTLRPDRLVVIVPAGHPLADRDQVAFSACLDYPFLGFTQGNPLQEHLSGQTHPLGLRPRYRAHLPITDAICAAVAAGVGIAVVPALAAAQWSLRDLRTVDLTNAWAHRNLLLCYRDRLQLSSPAAEFSAHLASVE